jgi:hypothetical protein
MSKILERRIYAVLNRIARQKGMTLHHSTSGYFVRRNGRIIKQSFALSEMQTFLLNEDN